MGQEKETQPCGPVRIVPRQTNGKTWKHETVNPTSTQAHHPAGGRIAGQEPASPRDDRVGPLGSPGGLREGQEDLSRLPRRGDGC